MDGQTGVLHCPTYFLGEYHNNNDKVGHNHFHLCFS